MSEKLSHDQEPAQSQNGGLPKLFTVIIPTVDRRALGMPIEPNTPEAKRITTNLSAEFESKKGPRSYSIKKENVQKFENRQKAKKRKKAEPKPEQKIDDENIWDKLDEDAV